MKRLEINNAKELSVAIRNEISRSEESRYDHRLHGILLVSEGMSCYDAGNIFGEDPRTVERWVKRFNEKGFNGLREGVRSGRHSRLTPQQMEQIGVDLRKNPGEFGYEQNLWDGKLLMHHIWEKFHVRIGVRTCQIIFHRLEFRRRKPRGVIAKGVPDEQDAFKKTL
ncbi:Transposase [Thermoplasmatales archaeon]|nr:Transposase [Thermoplasmatales archaeon]QRF75084.1 Transposase [Thermoplasmatales archaeon]